MWIVREAKLSDLSALLELEQCVVDAEQIFIWMFITKMTLQ